MREVASVERACARRAQPRSGAWYLSWRALYSINWAFWLVSLALILSGPFNVVLLTVPVLYLAFGILPVVAFSSDFFMHLLPYLFVNQLLFIVVWWG